MLETARKNIFLLFWIFVIFRQRKIFETQIARISFFSARRLGEGNQKRPSKLGRKMPYRKCSESRHAWLRVNDLWLRDRRAPQPKIIPFFLFSNNVRRVQFAGLEPAASERTSDSSSLLEFVQDHFKQKSALLESVEDHFKCRSDHLHLLNSLKFIFKKRSSKCETRTRRIPHKRMKRIP